MCKKYSDLSVRNARNCPHVCVYISAPSLDGQTKTLAECLQNASTSVSRRKFNADIMPAKCKQMCLRFTSVLPVCLKKKLNTGKMPAKRKHVCFKKKIQR